MEYDENENILISKIKCKTLRITPQTISEALNIPNKRTMFAQQHLYNANNITKIEVLNQIILDPQSMWENCIQLLGKIYYSMTLQSLDSRTWSFDMVIDIDFKIIHHVLNEISINLSFIIFNIMLKESRDPNKDYHCALWKDTHLH